MGRAMRGVLEQGVARWLILALGLGLAAGCGRKDEGGPAGRAPQVQSVVVRPGEAKPGDLLECDPEVLAGVGGLTTLSYQWKRNGETIAGATGRSLETKGFKKGDLLTVTVTPRDSLGEGKAISSKGIKLRNSPPVIVRLDFGPRNPTAGQDLTASVEAKDEDAEPISYRFRWWRGGQEISGVSGPTLSGTLFKRGDEITVSVIPKDLEEEGKEMRAIPTKAMGRPPLIESNPPPEAPSGGVFSYQVRGRDPDGGPLTYTLASGPSGMSIEPSTGMLSWPLPASRGGIYPVAVRVTTLDGTFAEQSFTIRY